MRDEQVACFGQFDRAAHQFCGDHGAVRLRHAARRDRCFRCIGRGFSGTAAIGLMAPMKR
jgi:hypothetical protein